MNQIIAEIASILKDSETLLDSEIRLDQYLPKVMCELVSKAIEMIDLELIHTYKEKGYDIQKTMKRTVQFSYGAVEIRRRRMRKDGEKSIVPLDEAIGLEEYIRYSPLVEMKAAKVASDGVYRKAADAINLLTPFFFLGCFNMTRSFIRPFLNFLTCFLNGCMTYLKRS